MNERTMDYEVIPFSDELFRIRILSDMVTTPEMRAAVCRWHEQLEILYVLDGTLVCECDFEDYTCSAGDIVVINPCEAHTVCYADAPSHYHCLMVDPGLYSSRGDISGIKYTEPMSERRIRFNHVIRNDRARTYCSVCSTSMPWVSLPMRWRSRATCSVCLPSCSEMSLPTILPKTAADVREFHRHCVISPNTTPRISRLTTSPRSAV